MWFYTAVGVSDSQKGDNFRVIDRVFDGPFNMGVGGRIKSQKNGLVTGALFFSSPRLAFLLRSFCASLKMPRSPCLAHKAPVMQATVKKNYYENI